VARGVVVAPPQDQFLVVEPVGREPDRGPRRTPPEQGDGPPGAGHGDGQLPGLGPSHGLHHLVRSSAAREAPDLLHVGRAPLGSHQVGGPEPLGPGQPLGVGVQDDGAGAGPGQEGAQHHPQGPAPHHGHGLPGAHPRPVHGVQGAGQGLGQGCHGEGEPLGETVEVHGYHPGRHHHLLGEPTQQVEQVLAQAEPAARAVEAGPAGRGVRAEHAVPGGEPRHPGAHVGHLPRELVAERRGVGPERGVAVAEHLDVRATGEGGPDPEHHLSRPRRSRRDVLHPEVARAVQEGRPHRPSTQRSPGPYRRAFTVPPLSRPGRTGGPSLSLP
jgi:hypothetical protein